MLKINSNKFNFNFFLSNNTKVNTLSDGAQQHGGATQYDNGIYSNIQGSDYISINDTNNKISIFIPSTQDVNKQTNNTEHVKYSINYLKRFYDLSTLKFYDTMGSWYSDDNKQVVIENITIITLTLDTITETDINIYIELAQYIKKAMSQEAVSISINDALAIV